MIELFCIMEIIILPPVKWEILFKIDFRVQKLIKNKYLPEIEKNPENKLNEFEWEKIKLYSYHFSIGKKNYRIIYKIYKNKIYVLDVGIRKVFSTENKEFFNKLNKRLVLLSKTYE